MLQKSDRTCQITDSQQFQKVAQVLSRVSRKRERERDSRVSLERESWIYARIGAALGTRAWTEWDFGRCLGDLGNRLRDSFPNMRV